MCSPLKQQTKNIITKEEVGDPQKPEGQWTALEVASDPHHAAGDPEETTFYKKNVKDRICDKVDLLGELSSNKYLLNTYYVQGTCPGTGTAEV